MKKKGRVKRQHFVPRCLLRRFSTSDNTTSVYVIGHGTFVETAAIKTQCAADYYYGHDQAIEEDLGQLEGAFSAAIGDLSVETLSRVEERQCSLIRAFVHIQAGRTPFAAALQRNAYVDAGRQLYTAYAKLNNLSMDDAPQQSEGFADRLMGIPAAHTVDVARQFQSTIADLEVKFVTATGFFISDHPALALNPWRDNHPRFRNWPHIGGLVTKGFMYLMPVATNRLVVIYDGDTYQIGDDNARVVEATTGDVIILNSLQTINASQLLFDSTVVKPFDVVAALYFRNQVRAEQGPGLLALRPSGLPLSFLRVIDTEPYADWDLVMLPSRPKAKIPDAAYPIARD